MWVMYILIISHLQHVKTVCIYIYTCIYVYISLSIYNVNNYIYTHIHRHIYIYIDIHIYIYIHTITFVHTGFVIDLGCLEMDSWVFPNILYMVELNCIIGSLLSPL